MTGKKANGIAQCRDCGAMVDLRTLFDQYLREQETGIAKPKPCCGKVA